MPMVSRSAFAVVRRAVRASSRIFGGYVSLAQRPHIIDDRLGLVEWDGAGVERKEIRRRSPRRTVTNAVLAMLGVPSRDPALPLWTLVCDRYYVRRNDTCSTLSYWGCLRR